MFGRLQHRQGEYKISSTPNDYSFFREVLDNLSQGKSSSRTHVNANENLKLEIEDKNKTKIIFNFPDYGGEQIDNIIKERKINKIWKDSIDNSTSWMLFIRLDEFKKIEDVSNRIPDNSVITSRNKGEKPLSISLSAYYIELLQMLTYVKGLGTFREKNELKITIVLSCWDNIDGINEKTKPSDLLNEKLPLVKEYIESVWSKNAISIIGLSSTGKTLDNKKGDDSFIDLGPENFGYIILEDGTKERDLTLSIKGLID